MHIFNFWQDISCCGEQARPFRTVMCCSCGAVCVNAGPQKCLAFWEILFIGCSLVVCVLCTRSYCAVRALANHGAGHGGREGGGEGQKAKGKHATVPRAFSPFDACSMRAMQASAGLLVHCVWVVSCRLVAALFLTHISRCFLNTWIAVS